MYSTCPVWQANMSWQTTKAPGGQQVAIDGREAMDGWLVIDKEENIIGFIYLFIYYVVE